MKSLAQAAPFAGGVFGGMWLHYNVFDEQAPWAFMAGVLIFFVLARMLLPIAQQGVAGVTGSAGSPASSSSVASVRSSANYVDRKSDEFRRLAGPAYVNEAMWQANMQAIQQMCTARGMGRVSLSEILTVGVQAMSSADRFGAEENPSAVSCDLLWHFAAGDLTFSNGLPLNRVMTISQLYAVTGEVLNWTRPDVYDRLGAVNESSDRQDQKKEMYAFLEKRIESDPRFSSLADLGISA